jgi:hypothetical protein
MLEEDGIGDPDEYFSELMWEFIDHARQPRPGRVTSAGLRDRATEVSEDPLTGGIEQELANTPTGGPSRPGGALELPALMGWATVLGVAALSIIVPVTSGDRWLWLMTAVAVPCALGWMGLEVGLSRLDLTRIDRRAS